METTLITLLAIIALAALIAAPTVYLRMRRRLELGKETHAQTLADLEREHEERLARLKRDAEQSRRYAHHKLALEVLPAIDALDEACKFSPSSHPSTQPDDLQQGIVLAQKQLIQALERQGIEYISPHPGDTFEPNCHEAVHLVDDETLQAGQIARCLRAGFRQEDRVLRSAMVEVVSNTPAESSPTVSPSESPPLQNDNPQKND